MSESQESERSAMERLLTNRWFQGASAVGVLLGLLGFVITLPPVADRLFGKRMALTLEVVSQIPVFDVRQPVAGLSVTLNGRDLTSSRRDLVAVRLRLRNTGDLSITPRNTTPADPLGFDVKGGQIARINEVSATSSHLRKLARPSRRDQALVLPDGLIFDAGDYVQFDLLVLKPEHQQLDFRAFGKVEGIPKIATSLSSTVAPSPGLVASTWQGSALAQLLRLITYPFMAIAALAAIIAPFAYVSSALARRKRRQRKAYAASAMRNVEEKDPKLRLLVPTLYEAIGAEGLKRLIDPRDPLDIEELEREREERRVARKLSDFEAAAAIQKMFEKSEMSIWRIKDFLERLDLKEEHGEVRPQLVEAANKFLAALEEVTSSRKVEDAEPDADFHTEYVIHRVARERGILGIP